MADVDHIDSLADGDAPMAELEKSSQNSSLPPPIDDGMDMEALKAEFAANIFDDEPIQRVDNINNLPPQLTDDEEQFDDDFEVSAVKATVSTAISSQEDIEALKAQYNAELGDDDDAAAFDSRPAAVDDDDEDDIMPIRHRKKEVKRFIDDDEDMAEIGNSREPDSQDILAEREPLKETGDNYFDNAADEDDDDIINIGAIKARYDSQIFNEKPASIVDEDESKLRSTQEEKVKIVAAEPKLQRPFQPTATPVSLDQRFMVWNEVGIVRCFNLDTEHSINVEFHDTAVHHSIHYDNTTMQFTMASLSSDALILANRKVEGILSSLMCMYFRTWDANKEWKVEMPDGENIDCISLGNGFVAAATDARFVRMWTIGGVQLNIFCLPGNAVTMSAQERSLMVIYHNGCPIPDDQSMSMYLLKVDSSTSMVRKQSTPNTIPVPLSPKSLLSWAGFTDEGTPCTADLKGIVRIYTNYLGNTWLPIANLRTTISNKSDHSFVIGLSEVQQQIRHIFCKGSRYPMTVPRPSVGLFSFELPLCGKHTTRGKFEEKYVRSKVNAHLLAKLLEDGYEVESYLENNDKEMGAALLRVFALALEDNAESLAFNISYLMPNALAVRQAITYAKAKKNRALAEKLVEVMQQKSEEVPDDLYENENMQHQASPHKNSIILAEKPGENHLRPKPMSQHKKKRTDEDDNEILFLDEATAASRMKPKPIGFSKAKKRTRTESDEEEDGQEKQQQTNRTMIIDFYFTSNRDRMQEENLNMEEDDLREIARDEFESLDEEARQEWVAGAIRRLQRGKSKKSNA